MADSTSTTYKKSDMVHVVDGQTGQVMEHPVPKTWIGTDLLPPGSKKATKTQVDKAEGDVVSVADAAEPDTGTVVVDNGTGDTGSASE